MAQNHPFRPINVQAMHKGYTECPEPPEKPIETQYEDCIPGSPEEQALNTIKVPTGVATGSYGKYCTDKRRFLITRDFLSADEKGQAAELLSDKWGLSLRGIYRIVDLGSREKGQRAEFAASINALQWLKRGQIMADAAEFRAHLQAQILLVQKSEDQWWAIEQVEDDSEKGGVKTRKMSRSRLLGGLFGQLQKLHSVEADALDQYMAKPARKDHSEINITIQANASREFKSELDRIKQLGSAEMVE